jgi:hypothetical protein
MLFLVPLLAAFVRVGLPLALGLLILLVRFRSGLGSVMAFSELKCRGRFP